MNNFSNEHEDTAQHKDGIYLEYAHDLRHRRSLKLSVSDLSNGNGVFQKLGGPGVDEATGQVIHSS